MRLVTEARAEDPELSTNAAVVRIGSRVGVNADTLRGWCKQADIDQRDSPGGLEFLREGARPATAVVIAFIDDHEARFGVAPICTVLSEHGAKIAPSTYYAAKARPLSARMVRDGELVAQIHAVFADRDKGRGLAGARKVWHLLEREDVQVARCTVERLMRQEGCEGWSVARSSSPRA